MEANKIFYDYFCSCGEKEEDVVHGMTETPTILCKICGKQMKILVSGGGGVRYNDQFGYAQFGNQEKPHVYKEVGTAVNYDLKNEMKKAGENGLAKGNLF